MAIVNAWIVRIRRRRRQHCYCDEKFIVFGHRILRKVNYSFMYLPVLYISSLSFFYTEVSWLLLSTHRCWKLLLMFWFHCSWCIRVQWGDLCVDCISLSGCCYAHLKAKNIRASMLCWSFEQQSWYTFLFWLEWRRREFWEVVYCALECLRDDSERAYLSCV